MNDAELEELAMQDRFWINNLFSSEFRWLEFGREVVRIVIERSAEVEESPHE